MASMLPKLQRKAEALRVFFFSLNPQKDLITMPFHLGLSNFGNKKKKKIKAAQF